jgi:glutamine amidotransferase
MCRLAAYLGPYIRLDQFLLEPAHNLLLQAAGSLFTGGSFASGFGLGWYSVDGDPAAYRQPWPIGWDTNLPHLARSLYSRLWLAAAPIATAPTIAHLQPLADDRLLFLHHGFVDDFPTLRRLFRDFLEPGIEVAMQSNGVSDYLFALLRHLLHDDRELGIGQALQELAELLGDWLGERRALLNLLLADGHCLYVTRHAINMDCPPLYYTVDDEAFPEGQLVASARLTEADFWQPLPHHHALILDPEQPPELLVLG